MRNETFGNTADVLTRRRHRRIWRKITSVLSCVVVFCVTYALILPAITLEQTANCGKQEHTHAESCYTQVTTSSQKELACSEQAAEHVHTEECYQTVEQLVDTQVLTCQLEESENHQHSTLCYGTWELNCGLEAHTHSAECSEAPQNAPPSQEPAVYSTPLQLSGYITTAEMTYRVGDGPWQSVKDTDLPGNAQLKLKISYANIHMDHLATAGYQVTYTLPSILRTIDSSRDILDDNKEGDNKEKMGTMTVKDGVVTLTFLPSWLTSHQSATGNNAISGSFEVESSINLDIADDNPNTQIIVGDVTINLNFEENIYARYANVTIQKNTPTVFQTTDSGDYLRYELVVTAGLDGAPSVVVKDTITTKDPSQIIGIVGVSPTTPADGSYDPVDSGATAGQPVPLTMEGGTMVWNIGNMAPSETRTLTYYVKLKEGYLGGAVKDPITNAAQLSCSGIDRMTANADFTPKGEATLSKVAGDFTPTADGGGTVTYTIWIHAKETNTYTLNNVRILDAMDGSISGGGNTALAYREHISFDTTSFKLYAGGNQDQNGADGLAPLQEGADWLSYPNGTTHPLYISYNAGSLAPGESKTLTYTLKVGPGVFAAAGYDNHDTNLWLYNRAQIRAGDEAKENETALNNYNGDKHIQKKVWNSKSTGVKQTGDTTVSISGKVYNADGTPMETPPAEFEAPAGSYKYTVTVNAAKDWDVSKASLRDQLNYESTQYAQYIGYVQVNAYNVGNSNLNAPDQTVWLHVDGLKTGFTFTPKDLDLTGVQSYVLTYYTQVTNIDDAPVIYVKNNFAMSGEVGFGQQFYTLGSTYVTVTNTIQDSGRFSVSKSSWYYEPPKVDTGEYANGAMYWYIQVDATTIPAGTQLRDTTSWNKQFMRSGSTLVGIYTGTLGNESIGAYDDLAHLQESGNLTALTSGYTVNITGAEENKASYPTMTVNFTDGVQLDGGKFLFVIVRTEPDQNPTGLPRGEYYTYKNSVESSFNGTVWSPMKTAQMVLYGNNGIGKQVEKVSTWNGTKETAVIPANGTTDSAWLEGLKNGNYVSWTIQLNRPGRLHGSYWVEELIPQGLELAYVQCTGVGTGYKTNARPSCAQQSPGEGWVRHDRAGTITTYYYTNGQTVRWCVDGLQTGSETHSIDFLVVCRLTDADVLMEGKEKTFQNQANLLGKSGRVIDSSVSPVTFSEIKTLTKEGIYSNDSPTQYPFTITLNALGEDLVPGSDTISLVDTLSETLRLDLSSIRVKNTDTGAVIPSTGWKAAVEGQILTLTLPDEMPLTVEYSAWINAKPGDTIHIFNNAHWEGYATPANGKVDNANFYFGFNASAGFGKFASIQITKRDENHLSTCLGGAVFSLSQVTVNADGTFAETPLWQTDVIPDASNMANAINVTDANGQLAFGVASDQTMVYNTIYCLRETQAPAGYVLDSTPYYFVIAQKETQTDGTEAYPTFPDGVYVHYLGPQYSYNALNHKGQITIQKKFSYPNGNDCAPVPGTYTFGLYTEVDGTGRPVGNPQKTVTITYSDKDTVKTAMFKDLTLGQSYYVFELDDAGNPIVNNGAFSDRFVVHYLYSEGSSCALTAENGDQTVTVNNQVSMPELPATGGGGTTMFYEVGSILLAGAAALLVCLNLRRKKTD